jgi:hypothetical protein
MLMFNWPTFLKNKNTIKEKWLDSFFLGSTYLLVVDPDPH